MSGAHSTLEQILTHLAEGRAIPDALSAHAATCSECGERLVEAERLFTALAIAPVEPPSPETIDRAWQRIARARALDAAARAVRRAGEDIRRVLAVLAGDTEQASHAVRGATTATPRILIYETDEVGISLSLGCQSRTGVALRGQVMPRRDEALPDDARAIVAVNAECREARISDMGEFDLGTLPFETLHLVIVLGTTHIELPPVEPGARS